VSEPRSIEVHIHISHDTVQKVADNTMRRVGAVFRSYMTSIPTEWLPEREPGILILREGRPTPSLDFNSIDHSLLAAFERASRQVC
jgi:hypothetical protein